MKKMNNLQFVKNTPIYRGLIHKNPKLLEKIITPEQIKLLFSPSSLRTIFEINEEISQVEQLFMCFSL